MSFKEGGKKKRWHIAAIFYLFGCMVLGSSRHNDGSSKMVCQRWCFADGCHTTTHIFFICRPLGGRLAPEFGPFPGWSLEFPGVEIAGTADRLKVSTHCYTLLSGETESLIVLKEWGFFTVSSFVHMEFMENRCLRFVGCWTIGCFGIEQEISPK